MYFTTHLLVGATAGGAAAALAGGQPWVALLAGVSTHAVLDVIPHHDYDRARWAVLDVVFGLTLASLAFRLNPPGVEFWGALGGVLPDAEVVLGHALLALGRPPRRNCFPSHSGLLPHPHSRFTLGLLVQAVLAGAGFGLLTR